MNDKRKKEAKKRFKVVEGEGKRFTFSGFKQAAIFYILLVLALIIIIQVGVHWLGQQYLAWRLQIVEAETGLIEQTVQANGIVTRHETAFKAPDYAIVVDLAGSGERITIGTELIRLGIISRADFIALQGTEEEEPDEQLWEQFRSYWQGLFVDVMEELEEGEVLPGEVPLEEEPEMLLDEEGPLDDLERGGENGEEVLPEQEPGGQENQTADDENNQDGQDFRSERIRLEGHPNFREVVVIKAEEPGFFSVYTDGWEEHEGPLYFLKEEDKGDEEAGSEGDEDPEEQDSPLDDSAGVFSGKIAQVGDLVEPGQPVAKLVDNWQWFFNVSLPLHPGQTLAGIAEIEILFDFAPEQEIKASLIDSEIDETAQVVRLTYLINTQVEGFDMIRQAGATLLYGRQKGIIIPEQSLLEKDGETGVYVNQGGRVLFSPVTVTGQQEDRVMVEGLSTYSLIISRPDLVTEGQRLN